MSFNLETTGRELARQKGQVWFNENGSYAMFDGLPEPTLELWESLKAVPVRKQNLKRGDIVIDNDLGNSNEKKIDYRVICHVDKEQQGIIIKSRGTKHTRFMTYPTYTTAKLRVVPKSWFAKPEPEPQLELKMEIPKVEVEPVSAIDHTDRLWLAETLLRIAERLSKIEDRLAAIEKFMS